MRLLPNRYEPVRGKNKHGESGVANAYQKNYSWLMGLVLFILSIVFYGLFLTACLYALAIPILMWSKYSESRPEYWGVGFRRAWQFLAFVIWPTALIGLGIKYLIDLGT
jgi:hypothetical protein